MPAMSKPWDYLIVTASNDDQAAAYRTLLQERRDLGLLAWAGEVVVVPDSGGRRIGSGGSTLLCLMDVLTRRLTGEPGRLADPSAWEAAFRDLRILIIHAGGDSKRLPAYGPCGKVFVPIRSESDSALAATLFDRQIPVYAALPAAEPGCGQIVITSGDVLLVFDPAEVRFAGSGVTGLGCYASPQQTAKHGAFCAGHDGRVRAFLQKPSPAEQQAQGAVDRYGRSILDIGVMSFDAVTAVTFLQAAGAAPDTARNLSWTGPLQGAIEAFGLDFYREICCGLGQATTLEEYVSRAGAGGSQWDEAALRHLFPVPSVR